MNAFLWTCAIVYGISNIGVVFKIRDGELKGMADAISALFHAAMFAWAVSLLVSH